MKQQELPVQENECPSDALIYCDGLVKMYLSDGLKVMALQGLDLEIQRGELLAIIGKSGSGKSTLLNMIGGLETPTAGRLFFHGRDLSLLGEKDMVKYRKRTVGFVWQKSARNLLPYMTVLENVEVPMYFEKGKKSEHRERAKRLLDDVGMLSHADKFPSQLSGGEAQRVAIAVALAGDPSVLLADEPTGAVDTKTSEQIFQLFRKLNQERGLTILIVTHDISLADKVNRVIMISDGKISTEKIRKNVAHTWSDGEAESQEEFVVLDRANRLQLSEEVLKKAGINGNKVSVTVEDGKVVITQQK